MGKDINADTARSKKQPIAPTLENLATAFSERHSNRSTSFDAFRELASKMAAKGIIFTFKDKVGTEVLEYFSLGDGFFYSGGKENIFQHLNENKYILQRQLETASTPEARAKIEAKLKKNKDAIDLRAPEINQANEKEMAKIKEIKAEFRPNPLSTSELALPPVSTNHNTAADLLRLYDRLARTGAKFNDVIDLDAQYTKGHQLYFSCGDSTLYSNAYSGVDIGKLFKKVTDTIKLYQNADGKKQYIPELEKFAETVRAIYLKDILQQVDNRINRINGKEIKPENVTSTLDELLKNSQELVGLGEPKKAAEVKAFYIQKLQEHVDNSMKQLEANKHLSRPTIPEDLFQNLEKLAQATGTGDTEQRRYIQVLKDRIDIKLNNIDAVKKDPNQLLNLYVHLNKLAEAGGSFLLIEDKERSAHFSKKNESIHFSCGDGKVYNGKTLETIRAQLEHEKTMLEKQLQNPNPNQQAAARLEKIEGGIVLIDEKSKANNAAPAAFSCTYDNIPTASNTKDRCVTSDFRSQAARVREEEKAKDAVTMDTGVTAEVDNVVENDGDELPVVQLPGELPPSYKARLAELTTEEKPQGDEAIQLPGMKQ